jgi:hypothetical protein
MKAFRFLTVAGVAFCILAGPADAADSHLWAKMGATQARAEADLAACHAQAHDVPIHIQNAAFLANAAAGPVGGPIATLIIAEAKKAEIEATFDHHCMRRHGYVWLPLTAREQKALGEQKTPQARAAWIDALYNSDIVQRLDAAWKPAVPPLPVALDEPFTYGALRIDPAAFTAATGEIGNGQTLLAGKAAHRHTARLKHAADAHLPVTLHADAGTVFFEAVYPTDFDPAQTYWCGVLHAKYGVKTRATDFMGCIRSNDTGYQLLPIQGEPWMMGPPDLESGDVFETAGADFSMEESPEDLLGEMDLRFTVKRVSAGGVLLEANAQKDGRSVLVWSGELRFDGKDEAVLPFWSHRLKIARKDKHVTAVLTPDGDGAGWDEAKLVG